MGIIIDFDGNYFIDVFDFKFILVFFFIGYVI